MGTFLGLELRWTLLVRDAQAEDEFIALQTIDAEICGRSESSGAAKVVRSIEFGALVASVFIWKVVSIEVA